MVISKENFKKKTKKLTKKHKKPQRSKKGKKVSKPVKKKTLKGKLSKLHGGTSSLASGSGFFKEAIKEQIHKVIGEHRRVVDVLDNLFKNDSFLKGMEEEAAMMAKMVETWEMEEGKKREEGKGDVVLDPVENEFQREFNEYHSSLTKEIEIIKKDPRYKFIFFRNLVLNLLMPSFYRDKSMVPVIGYLYDVAYDKTWGGVEIDGLYSYQKKIIRKYLPTSTKEAVFRMWLDKKRKEEMEKGKENQVSQPQQQGGSKDEGVEEAKEPTSMMPDEEVEVVAEVPTSMMPGEEEIREIFAEAGLGEGGVETVPRELSGAP